MSKYNNNFSLFRRCQENINKSYLNESYSPTLYQALVLISYGMIKLYGKKEENNIQKFITSINFIYSPRKRNDFISKIDKNRILYPTIYYSDALLFNNFKDLIYKINFYFYKSRKNNYNICLSFRDGFYSFTSKDKDDSFLESLIRLEGEDILKNIINLRKIDNIDSKYRNIILSYFNKPYSFMFDGYENEVNLLRNLYYQREFKKSFIHSNKNDNLMKMLFSRIFGEGSYDDFRNLFNDFSYSLKENDYYISSNIYCSIRNKYILKYLRNDDEKCFV